MPCAPQGVKGTDDNKNKLKIRNVAKNYTHRFFHLQHCTKGGCYGRYSDVEGALSSESSTFNLITGVGAGGGLC